MFQDSKHVIYVTNHSSFFNLFGVNFLFKKILLLHRYIKTNIFNYSNTFDC